MTLYPVLNGDWPIGTVVSQSPAANDKADKETPVSISYSGGKTTVPLLKGMTLAEAVSYYDVNEPRGEYVLILEGAGKAEDQGPSLEECLMQVRQLRETGLSLKDAVKQVSKSGGIPKNTLYEAALADQS